MALYIYAISLRTIYLAEENAGLDMTNTCLIAPISASQDSSLVHINHTMVYPLSPFIYLLLHHLPHSFP